MSELKKTNNIMSRRTQSTIWSILFIVSIVVAFITVLYNRQSDLVPNLFCLPIAYCFSLVLARRLFFKQMGLAMIIMEIIMFLRYIIIPLMYALNKSYSGVVASGADFSKAVWLMVYEEFMVSIAMYCWSRTKHSGETIDFTLTREKRFFRPITIAIIIYWFFIIAVNEKLRGRLFNFKLLTKQQLGFAENYSLGEYNADIPGAFSVFFSIGLVVLITSVVISVAKSHWKSFFKGLVITFALVGFLSSMWSNGFSVSRWGLLVGTVMCMYILIYAFPQKTKIIIIAGGIALLAVIIVGSVLKTVAIGYTSKGTFDDAFDKYLNVEMFDEYFEGIAPVANGIVTAERFASERGAEYIFVDTCYNFPYAMKILGLSERRTATHYFHLATGKYDLIMPTVTQGYMQFGAVFAPLYSVVLVILALWLDRKRASSRSLYKRLFYTQLVFWVSLFMAVSTNVIEANVWSSVIAIWIISIEEKYKFRIGTRNEIIQTYEKRE